MNWEAFRLHIENAKIAGKSAGEGKRLLIGLHGYGKDRHMFDALFKAPPPDTRLLMLDLPFFGESTWPDAADPIDPAFLNQLILALKDRFEAETIALLGFSLGAKFALGLFMASEAPIAAGMLIAPDGLRIHPIYRFCIYTRVGRLLFRTVLKWPGLFLFLNRILYKLRLADAFKYRFVKSQFVSRKRRELLKNVWFGYAGIRPDVAAVAAHSGDWDTKWHVIWGKQDNILPPRLGKRFAEQVPGAEFRLIDGGHLLIKTHAETLGAAIANMMKGIN